MIIFVKDLAGNVNKYDYNEETLSVIRLKKDLYIKNYITKLFFNSIELVDRDNINDGDVIDLLYEKDNFNLFELEKYEKSLFYFLGSHKKLKLLKKILIEHNAIIGGDSVLRMININDSDDFDDFEDNDNDNNIDIYVNYKKGESLIESLKRIGFDVCFLNVNKKDINMNENYKKNRVMSYFSLEYKRIVINVFIIHDLYELEKLINNQDFSFCQVWYDGENLQCTDIVDIREKNGILNNNYIDNLYKDLNLVLIDRIKRYTKYGYKINTNFHYNNFNNIAYYNENTQHQNENEDEMGDILYGLSVFVYKQTRNRDFIITPFDKNNYNKLFFKIFMKDYNKEEYIDKWGKNFFNFWCRLYYNYNKNIKYINEDFLSEKIDLNGIFIFKLQWFSYLS